MGFIYKISNNINTKLYVGQTKQKDPQVRWRKHLYDAGRKRGCPLLGNAIRKHGADSFKFEVIMECPDDECNTHEIRFISELNALNPNGYNAHPGGKPGGSFKGLTHTPEVRAIIGQKSKAYHARPGIKQLHSESRKDFYKDPAKREALSKVMKTVWENKVHNEPEERCKPSEETKQKIRKSLLKYYAKRREPDNDKSNIIEEARQRRSKTMIKAIGRRVYQYSLKDEFIAEYECIKGAADALGMQRRAIQACLCGYSKTSGGYKWVYAD